MSDSPQQKSHSHATFACMAISIMISVPWLLYDHGHGMTELRQVMLLAPTSSQIFAEHLYWGLVTATFIHLGWIHLLFNMMMMFRLSPTMENEIGSFRWLGFFLAAALVTSGFQLTIDGSGLGMSGVLYAIFGYMWQARRRYPIFGEIVTPEIVKLLLGWLVLCYFLTWFKLMAIANTAHLTGLIFGYAAAWTLAPKRLMKQRVLAYIVAGGMIAVSVASIAFDLRLVTVSYRLAERAQQRNDLAGINFWGKIYRHLGGDYRRDIPAVFRRKLNAGDYEEAAKLIPIAESYEPGLAAELRKGLETHRNETR